MSVVRVHKTKNYTVLSNYHFREKGLSLKAKGLLSLMLSLPDTWNYSVSGLVTLSKDGKDSVMSALAELEKFGYLERERQTNEKGQFAGIEYHIYEEPQQKKPIAEIPIEENSASEKPIAENTSQLNTNLSITNSIKNNTDELNIYKGEVGEEIETILATVSYASLREMYEEYIEMRLKINAPLSPLGLEKLIKRNERLTRGDYNLQKVLLEAAIINNWKNVYLPNEAEVATVNKLKIQELREMYGIE
jgi:hypothetical protein